MPDLHIVLPAPQPPPAPKRRGGGGLLRLAFCVLVLVLFSYHLAFGASPAPVPASGIVVVGGGLPSSFAPLAPERSTADLNAIATQLAGRPTDVHCDPAAAFAAAGEADADGYVQWNSAGLVLSPEGHAMIHVRQYRCLALESLGLRSDTNDRSPNPVQWDIYGGHISDPPDGAAVAILGHEATHVRLYSTDEGEVECANDRAARFDVAPYHLPDWLAQRVIWGEHQHHAALPPNYLTVC